MGAFCCCPCGEEFEEYTHPSSSIYRHCTCLRHFFQRLLNGNSAMFQRMDGRNITLSIQGGTPLASTGLGTVSDEGTLSETYHLVPRPASYDTDPRYARSQRDGLVSRHEKSLSHIQEGSRAIKRSSSSSGTVHLGAAKKKDITDVEEESKASQSESQKILSGKLSYGIDYLLTSEDEDVCPTCLEAAYMSGWKEVRTVQFVARRWSFVRAHDCIRGVCVWTIYRGFMVCVILE